MRCFDRPKPDELNQPVRSLKKQMFKHQLLD